MILGAETKNIRASFDDTFWSSAAVLIFFYSFIKKPEIQHLTAWNSSSYMQINCALRHEGIALKCEFTGQPGQKVSQSGWEGVCNKMNS